ncbi:hypothetical protein BofuT4_P048390.1 [Botrytis cinerea T4]|uniref:Uncharacterized protein n=1 Tax=Botryotinia fuckeliana (strain T4) TaxID=999810 RepID=G2XZD4_BOTF4|nr:hypothetical protein BofuT4_P048390.1 [Botrytis cinerea T4]
MIYMDLNISISLYSQAGKGKGREENTIQPLIYWYIYIYKTK